MGFNTTVPPFTDQVVRQAVAHAIDRSRITQATSVMLATGLEPPGCIGHNANARLYNYDPQRARQLLEQAGIKPEELGELGLWVLSLVTRDPNGRRRLDMLVANLTAIGLQVRERQFGNYNALEAIATQPVVKTSFWGIGWDSLGCSQGTFLESMVHSKGFFNYFGYRNVDVDRLIDQARAATDRGTKTRLYQEAEQKILDDAVVIPIWWRIGP